MSLFNGFLTIWLVIATVLLMHDFISAKKKKEKNYNSPYEF